MLKQFFFLSAIVSLGFCAALADTIQLKDKAAVVGKILSEKRDQVVVDVGFTVLVIPRNQIVKIGKSDGAEPAAKPVAVAKGPMEPTPPPAVEARPGFYAAPSKAAPLQSVRDLVNQIGE